MPAEAGESAYENAVTLGELLDVTTTTPAAVNQVPLVWNAAGSTWQPYVKLSAIAAANTQTGAYVQADVQSIATAVNLIRTALQNAGITL